MRKLESGEGGIRTLGTLLGHTRFPSVRLQPAHKRHVRRLTKRIQSDGVGLTFPSALSCTSPYLAFSRIQIGGEGGIRTHGRGCLHLISSQAPSSTRPPLRIFAFSASFSIRRRRKNFEQSTAIIRQNTGGDGQSMIESGIGYDLIKGIDCASFGITTAENKAADTRAFTRAPAHMQQGSSVTYKVASRFATALGAELLPSARQSRRARSGLRNSREG